MLEKNSKNQVAVFFDYENIVYSLRNRFEQKANFEALMTKCQEFGQIVVAKAYADWGLPYISPALTYALQSSGFDLEFVPTGATQANSPRKNVADLYMAIQTMDALMKYPEVDTFILLTGDRDFMLLVNYLKRSGKKVVAIGVDGSSSYYLTQAVDDFFYYSEVEEIYEGKPRRMKGRPTNIYDALVQAVQIIREKGKNPRLTNIKPIMIELLGGFDEKEYKDEKGRNFQKFKDFVNEAQRRGFIKLVSRNNRHEIYLPNERPSGSGHVQDDADEPIEIENAFKLLVRAVRQAERDGKSRRSAAIKHRMGKMIPGFEETNVVDEDGEGFTRFSDFLDAAEKAGHIRQTGEGARVEVRSADSKEAEADEAVEEVDLTAITGQAARAALLEAMQAYNNYPTSFLSLAAHCHRHSANNGLTIDENEARELMTEAVKIGLLSQIVKSDGRRAYELNASAELVAQFLQQAVPEEVQAIVEDSDEEEEIVEEEVAAPTFTNEFEALAEAVRLIVAEGKDPVLPRVKSVLRTLVPDFDEKNHKDESGATITKFKDFVLECERRGLVRLKIEGTVNRVFLADSSSDQSASDQPQQPEEVQSDDAAVAVEETTVDLEDMIDVDEVEAMLAETKNGLISVDEMAQRQLVVDGLRKFGKYPAPFMAVLSGVRKLRNERGIELPNNDLRDLLSEANRTNLLTQVSEKGARPTLYTFIDDDALVRLFVVQEESAQPDVVEKHVETVEKEVPKPEPEPVPEPVVETAAATISYYELRRMIVAALREYGNFPAQFPQIFSEVMAVRERNNINATDRELRELLNEASRSNILPMVSVYGTRPRLFELTKDEDAIKAFIGEPSSRDTRAEKLAEKQADEPEADVTVESVAEAETVVENATEESGTPFDLLIRAVETLQADNNSTVLSTVKRRMRQIDKSFDEKKLMDSDGKPYKRFTDFVQDAVQQGHVTTEGKGRGRRVTLMQKVEATADESEEVVELEESVTEDVVAVVEESKSVDSTPEPEIQGEADVTEAEEIQEAVADVEPVQGGDEESDVAAKKSPLIAGFELIAQAVTDAVSEERSQRLTAIRARMVKIDSDFEARNLHDATGKNFKSFSAFARAAEEAGYINLSGKGLQLQAHPK